LRCTRIESIRKGARVSNPSDPSQQPPTGQPSSGPPPGPPGQSPAQAPPPGPGAQPPPPQYQAQPPGGYPPPPPGYQQNLNAPPPQYQGQYPQQPYQGYPAAAPSAGLAPNIAAMLSYLLFGWIGGLIMYLTQRDREVRFHAAQSILTFGGLAIISVVLNTLNLFAGSALLAMLVGLIGLASFVLWIFLSIQGYQLKHTKLPVVGDIAEQWAIR
jgi:uncharacterized membrane protein